VPEQDGERVAPAVLLDHVQVAVANPGRLDPNEHLPRPWGRDGDLLEGNLAGSSEDYAALSHERSRSRTE
jgi:hypothetical protein